MEPSKKPSKKLKLILAVIVLIGVSYAGYKFINSFYHEGTDDAQVQSNMTAIIPHVGGYIQKVYVVDNQFVKKGDTLFVIDNRDYISKLNQAEANVEAAKSQLIVANSKINSNVASAKASDEHVKSASQNIEVAKIKLWRATNDFQRYKNLYKKHSITTQQYEQALAAKQEAEKSLEIIRNQQNASSSQQKVAATETEISKSMVAVAQSNLKSAEAMLAEAQLQLSYTVVTAPVNGQLSSIGFEAGQLVQAGQSLFYLINTDNKWIVANFKETQLGKMKLGQKVSIKVDAFPDDNFDGIISAFSPATGARFSILPPDNATGNFVKTVQRVPVKINFTKENNAEQLNRLSSGMNVVVDVHIK
jgi:membrane fusion protein (multidrug efflux system)